MGKKIETVDSISEKLTSDHFKKSIETYKLLFESSEIPIFVFDLTGQIVLSNQAVIKIMGLSEEEYIGKPLKGILGEKVESEYLKRIEILRKSESSLQSEDYIELATGNYWILSCFSRIYDNDDKVNGIQVIWINITERKKNKENKQKSEERFRSLYQNSSVGMYRTSPDGKIILANPALVKILGYSSFDEMSKKILLRDGYEPACDREEFKEVIENLSPHQTK